MDQGLHYKPDANMIDYLEPARRVSGTRRKGRFFDVAAVLLSLAGVSALIFWL